jgi:hypothetical protein
LSLSGLVCAQDSAFMPPGDHWMDWQDNTPYAPAHCEADKALFNKWVHMQQRLATVWARTPGATGPALYAAMQGVLTGFNGPMQGAWSIGRSR